MTWKKVQSRLQLADYIGELRKEIVKGEKYSKKQKLDDYFEALAAVVSDYDGFRKNLEGGMDPDEPAWSTFAHMLAAAMVYE